MTVEQMIQYLRTSVSVQDPNATQDPAYLSMTDDQLVMHMTVALSRDFPTLSSLEDVTNAELYPLMLLARKDLFHALAVKEAPLYDIGADNNNYLKRDQRFQHYLKLIEQLNKEYEDYLENGGGSGAIGNNTLTSYEVLLSSRYSTSRNRMFGFRPIIKLSVDNFSATSIEISWYSWASHFHQYLVYVSESPILDLYNTESHVKDSATLVETIYDVHQTQYRIEDLKPDTLYYVAVGTVDISLLKSYSEISVTTPPL